jgi:hypothetical protein
VQKTGWSVDNLFSPVGSLASNLIVGQGGRAER